MNAPALSSSASAKPSRNKFLELQQNSSSDNKNFIKPKTSKIFVRGANDSHPSRDLIQNLSLSIDELYAESFDEAKFLERSLQNVPLHWIDTEDGLKEMYEKLKEEKIIAVDLEHHSFHSYIGLVSLIQISGSNDDYLIDPIRLREALQSPELSLSCLLSDPKILKIFHGAESDIAWLQRDFDTLVVNMFDSFHAAKVLNLPRMSLAFLLETFCGVELDKKYQLADWRERPIPDEMIEYARKDTHYLHHLYHLLKAKLTKVQYEQVIERSNRQCLEPFSLEGINDRSWKTVLDRSNYPLFGDQVETVRRLFYWREWKAKELDVSPAALLQNSFISKIAHSRARSIDDLKGCLRNVSTLMLNEMSALSEYLLSDESRESEFVVAQCKGETADNCSESVKTVASSHIRFEGEEAQDPLLSMESTNELPPSNKRVRRVSFAPKTSTDGCSSLFTGASNDQSKILLAGLSREGLPKVQAHHFITREQEEEERSIAGKAKEAEEKAKAEAIKSISEKALVHGSNRVVEDSDMFGGGGSKSTHLADKLRKNVKQTGITDGEKVDGFDYSTKAEDSGVANCEPEVEVFDPYSTIRTEKKRAFIEATIAPATGPRLSTTRMSGNRMSTFTKKNKK